MYSTFAKKILLIQKAEGDTRTKMSKKTGISYNTLYDYEKRPIGKPSLYNIKKIIEAYPKYTFYILDIEINKLPKQISLDD